MEKEGRSHSCLAEKKGSTTSHLLLENWGDNILKGEGWVMSSERRTTQGEERVTLALEFIAEWGVNLKEGE